MFEITIHYYFVWTVKIQLFPLNTGSQPAQRKVEQKGHHIIISSKPQTESTPH